MIVLPEEQASKIREILVRIIDGENFLMSDVEDCLEFMLSPTKGVFCPFEKALGQALGKVLATEVITALGTTEEG